MDTGRCLGSDLTPSLPSWRGSHASPAASLIESTAETHRAKPPKNPTTRAHRERRLQEGASLVACAPPQAKRRQAGELGADNFILKIAPGEASQQQLRAPCWVQTRARGAPPVGASAARSGTPRWWFCPEAAGPPRAAAWLLVVRAGGVCRKMVPLMRQHHDPAHSRQGASEQTRSCKQEETNKIEHTFCLRKKCTETESQSTR